MSKNKTILEEALLDVNLIKEALGNNTKEILRAVAYEEIDEVVTKKINESAFEVEEIETDENELPENPDSIIGADELEGGEVTSTDEPELELDDVEASDEIGSPSELEGSEEIDLTGVSDEELVSVYKKLNGSEEIEIVTNDNQLEVNVTEPGEYVIDLDSIIDSDVIDSTEDEVEYEIELDNEISNDADTVELDNQDTIDEPEPIDNDEPSVGEPESSEEQEESSEESEEDEEAEETIDEKISVGVGMSVGNHSNERATGSLNAPENPKRLDESETKKILEETANKYNQLLSEAIKLKNENDEIKQALKEFRKKLVETVVFNSNLAQVTKLFTEFSTTKSEKQSIIERFDQVTNIKESKNLYKTIVNELSNRTPITESVEKKINKDVSTGSSKVLTETTAYVDPSTQRIMELFGKIK